MKKGSTLVIRHSCIVCGEDISHTTQKKYCTRHAHTEQLRLAREYYYTHDGMWRKELKTLTDEEKAEAYEESRSKIMRELTYITLFIR